MGAAAKSGEAVEALLANPPAKGAAWAEAARAEARARLTAMGAPGRRDEYWKYTDPAPLLADGPEAEVMEEIGGPIFGEADALTVVFVDGAFRADLSDDLAGQGIEAQPLADALGSDIHWAKGVFGALEAEGQSPVPRPLAALNTVMAAEGVCLRVTETPDRPVHIRYIREDAGAEAMVRHVVQVASGASLTLLESGAGAARLNCVVEIDVAEDAALHHVRSQGRDWGRLAATALFARLAARATFKSFTLTMNGRLTRNEAVMTFTGDDAVGHIAGASIGEGAFHHDDTVFVTHDAVGCESRQVFKKVLRGGARGVFQGKILVREGAQKTDGYQVSQGLLLTDDAEFDAKPELEIYADDVACSHGSTCGAVDETALFYLRSRGVPLAEAQDMMVLAFVDEAVAEIEDEALADEVRARIAGWLARHAAR